MYFVISCVDKLGQPGLRQDNRPEGQHHRASRHP